MEIRQIRELNQHETYPVTKKQLKFAFAAGPEATALFGLRRKFEYDSRRPHKTKLEGTVVANASCNRDKDISLYLFPIAQADYPEEAKDEFVRSVLPHVKAWMTQQLNKPDTAVLGVEELLIEWDGNQHKYHYSKFL